MKNLFLCLLLLSSTFAFSNNVLVQNVTTTGNNATNKTIQVQFDLSWDNSWRDAINWDAAWIFMKFKNASGVWQHVQLNTTGFTNGTGTANTVQVTADKVGAWVYRSALGSGTFSSTTMQLQWNYGLSGLTSVAGLEVRVYAVEMVYVPQGDFNCAGKRTIRGSFRFSAYDSNSSSSAGEFYAPGDNFPVINDRLSPTLTYTDESTKLIRIKGDTGIDTDNNGTVDNITYPIGYRPFYCYKYEMTEQQYADFLNTLTATQVTNIGVAGTGITLSNGQYFSSSPNRACSNATVARLLSFADWSGVRPITFLEMNKVSYGPLKPFTGLNSNVCIYPVWSDSNYSITGIINTPVDAGYFANVNSTQETAKASLYGILELNGSVREPVVKLNYLAYTELNGNGTLLNSGNHDVLSWVTSGMIIFYDMTMGATGSSNWGFRYVRSAE